VVKAALAASGDVRFERIAMQPGKPQGFGRIDGVPVFTLPGNPVSALVSFELFVRPAVRRMRGLPTVSRPEATVTVGEDLTSPAGKRSYLRVRLNPGEGGDLIAHLSGGQGSHQLSALAAADALLIVPEEVTAVQAGTRLPALLLSDRSTVLPDRPVPVGAMAHADTDRSGFDTDRSGLSSRTGP
jgi:molybdopterin molybdotransferase